MFPIALHISDSTLHILQCPSRIPHSGRRYSFGNAAFPPSAAHGSLKGYSSESHLYLCLKFIRLYCITILFIESQAHFPKNPVFSAFY